jgi:nicotinamidase-related amidase
MKIPASGKKKALVIVDVQGAFLRPRNRHVIDVIVKLINEVPYDFYVDVNFDTQRDSLWQQQEGWSMPEGTDIQTDVAIMQTLQDKPHITIQKSTRSAFKGDPSLKEELQEHDIDEIHVVGLASHDCVLATSLDGFDNGFLTFVLEEGCQSTSEKGANVHNDALSVLRYHKMTNNSCLVPTVTLEG